MNLLKFRSMSAKELEGEQGRTFRFEIWREEPNAEDRPYRRKRDRRTKAVWHSGVKTWKEVLALVKRGQCMRIRTYLRRGSYGGGSIRMIAVHINNRVKK